MIQASEIIKYLKGIGYDCTDMLTNDFEIRKHCSLYELKDNCITWVKDYASLDKALFAQNKNVLVVAQEKVTDVHDSIETIICSSPKAAFFSAVERFFCNKRPAGISGTAVVETSCVGKNVSIGHFTYIGKDAVIADDVEIGNNVSIEGSVTIGQGSTIGSGTVIGSVGFGYYKNQEGKHQRIPHTGGVEIGSFVDIGSNVCIDRGTINNTVIEDYVKIDNLCHIAHNVHIAPNAMVVALSLLAGSSRIGENAYIAPGAMIMNQKSVGKNSLVGMGSVVVKDVPEGKVVAGVPAKVLRENQ